MAFIEGAVTIIMEGLRKTRETLVTAANIRAEILNTNLPNELSIAKFSKLCQDHFWLPVRQHSYNSKLPASLTMYLIQLLCYQHESVSDHV
jgi:hypothetical protein